ncbi:type III secretion system chaperone [Hydrogenophaga sp.]|uniref:type III secretion system chaperone n=1 Tax=Hydrogenophaga sp. TaxID=1904254 RepID=UPI00271B0890|nr:type III secretion system chaperone [Hydrogenophaga sp.]MDO9437434.1 type III secretion system chaperone [Hydrogenophaga sp.]
MNHSTRHNHSWFDLMTRFAQQMGEANYRSGALSFAEADGPTVVAELLDDGRALAMTVDLQHKPDPSELEAFLAANRVQNAQDAGIYAFSPVEGTLLFFRRLEDAGQYTYEEWIGELQAFERSAKAALQAVPHALEGEAPSPQDDGADNAESFKHIWSDFAYAQKLGAEPPELSADGSYILALEGLWHVFVRPDNARGRVVLKMAVTLLPLLIDDEPAVWSSLLKAHTLGQGTGGAFFAIDHEEQELVVWRSLPLASLDGYGLNDAIDSLAQVARHYTEELKLDPFTAAMA